MSALLATICCNIRRADISVAVSVPTGLITPIVTDADEQIGLRDLDRNR